MLVFDGEDDEAVAAARAHWSDGQGKGFEATYWQPDEQRPLGEEGLTGPAGPTRPMNDRPMADLAR